MDDALGGAMTDRGAGLRQRAAVAGCDSSSTPSEERAPVAAQASGAALTQETTATQATADRTTAAKGTAAAAVPVEDPVYVRRIDPGQNGWFSSPALVDLNGDTKLEIVAPLHSLRLLGGRQTPRDRDGSDGSRPRPVRRRPRPRRGAGDRRRRQRIGRHLRVANGRR